jgi:heme exporter protein D
MNSLDRLTVTFVTSRYACTLPALLVLIAQSPMHHTSMLQSLLRAALLLASARAHIATYAQPITHA